MNTILSRNLNCSLGHLITTLEDLDAGKDTIAVCTLRDVGMLPQQRHEELTAKVTPIYATLVSIIQPTQSS